LSMAVMRWARTTGLEAIEITGLDCEIRAMSPIEILLATALGVALAAAVGLRVFVPLLVVALAARMGNLDPPTSFAWIGTTPAIATLAIAAVAEIAAYYIPGVDNLLDMLMTPLALIAGTLVMVAPLWDLPPLVKWTVAIVAGGGAAGVTQGLSAVLRAKSTVGTAGLGNPVISTGELGGSLLISIVALLVPILALACVLLLLAWLLRRWWRARARPGEGAQA
jgi:hypothetical protein